MPVPKRLLSIEDNPVDSYLIRATFSALARRRPAATFEITQAKSLAAGLEAMKQHPPHVVLVDLWLPDAGGPEAVARLRELRPDVPILVLTGRDDEALAHRALQAGAQDYLVKGRLDMQLLDRVVLHAIERQRLASALARAHARELERRDEFLSHVSHELRTPLSAIQQFASILHDGLAGDLAPRQVECVEVLQRNASHLRRMVDDLLDVARADAGRLAVRRAPVDLGPVIEQTLGDLQARVDEKGLSLVTKLGAARTAYADPMRIGQVLGNLVENAVKFTPRGGRVEVVLADGLDGGMDGDDVLRLSVLDDGCGIEPGELPSVFGRLRQAQDAPEHASRKGLGLGLHICREIAELHGGWIWAESTPGEGSAFHLALPVFSLEKVLAPLFARGRGHDEPFHLLTVEAPGGTQASEAHVTAIDAAVRRCGEEAQGVVLPAGEGDQGRRLVVRCPGTGARTLVQRLRRRLTRDPSFSGRSGRPEISRRVLLVPLPGGSRTMLPELARRLGLPASPRPQRRQAKGTSRTMTQ